MRKVETIHRRYNEKLLKLLVEFESKLCASIGTNYQGVKTPIRTMISREFPKSGIATAYALYHRTEEFTDMVDATHPVFRKK